MTEQAIALTLFKLALGLVGILMGRASLVFMDFLLVRINTPFSKWYSYAESKDKAYYYSARLLFVAIIIHGAIG